MPTTTADVDALAFPFVGPTPGLVLVFVFGALVVVLVAAGVDGSAELLTDEDGSLIPGRFLCSEFLPMIRARSHAGSGGDDCPSRS